MSEDEAGAVAQLRERSHALSDDHRFASQWRLLQEAVPRAKAAQDLEATIHFLFTIANSCHHTLTPKRQREASVELVTILESEETARRIQPDLSDELYATCKHWYTSCAYDNLATAVASEEGYNSEGMYGALGEGIEKCRQTGKTQCITCFREYGVQVSIAADDLELASKQAQALSVRAKDLAMHDRRAVSWQDLGWIAEVQGDLVRAIELYLRSYEVAADYHDPEGLRLTLHRRLERTWTVLGEPGAYAAFLAKHPRRADPEPGESLADELQLGRLQAAQASCRGDHDRAIELFRRWCLDHEQRHDLVNWFEDRTLLCAALLLAGRREAAEAVAQETSARAREARNWLTLRRLKAQFAEGFPVNPLATVAPCTAGPFAERVAGSEDLASSEASRDAAGGDPGPPTNPTESPTDDALRGGSAGGLAEPRESESESELQAELAAWQARIEASEEPEQVLAEVAAWLLSLAPQTIEDAQDAFAWLRAAYGAVGTSAQPARLWKQARLLAKRFPQAAAVQGILADLGDVLRTLPAMPEEERPELGAVEALYRRALELDPQHGGTHYNAGVFYARTGNMGEAERCFARAFRLRRRWAPAALSLAQVYRETDRPTDALDALDLALRHGCDDPQVAWRAGNLAFELGRWEPAYAYLSRFLELGQSLEWTDYFRCLCLIELGRHEQALACIAAEGERNPHAELAVHGLSAACLAALERGDEAHAALEAALALPLARVERMARAGVASVYERMRQGARALGDAEVLERVVTRALRAGILDDAHYDELRQRPDNPPREGLSVFRVGIEQDLDPASRRDPSTPAWEVEWRGYRATWYVLCADPAEAEAAALAEQNRCATPAPRVIAVNCVDEGDYRDRPGVLGCGARAPLGADEA